MWLFIAGFVTGLAVIGLGVLLYIRQENKVDSDEEDY